MKLIKRALCLALVVLMLLSVVACGGGGGNNTTTPAGGGDSGTTPEETTSENREDDLPDIDMGGEDIVIYSLVQTANAGSFDAMKDGNVINNSVYERNQGLIKRLNCTIKVKETVGDTNTTTVQDELNKLKESFTYNIATTTTLRLIDSMNDGLFHDLANKSRIDLNKDYYDDGYNNALNAAGRQYMVTGKFTHSWYRYQIVTLFNRNMFKAKNIEYPYELVLEGNGSVGGWTTAKMMEVAADMYVDNGNGQYDAEDTYGYCLFVGNWSSQTDGFMGAFGLRLIEKAEDGYYKMIDNMDASQWVSSLEELLGFLGQESVLKNNTIGNEGVVAKFVGGTSAMITFRMYCVEENDMINLGRTREGYGILPLPKANDEQEEYYSYVQDQVLSFAVPNSLTDVTELLYTTHFIEAFASEAYNTTMPAYYEKALTKRFVTDVPSHEMIKIIDSNIYVDPANAYQSFGFNTTDLRTVYDGSTQPSQLFSDRVLSGKFAETIAKQNEKLKSIDEQLKVIEDKFGLVV